MSEGIQERLREFTCLLLGRQGAEVEWPEGAGEGLAVLPPPTAQALKCLEVLPLSFQTDAAMPVNLATDFLERVEPLVAAEPRIAYRRVDELYLKRASMDEPVARVFTWLNARVVVRESAAMRTEYHCWFFRAGMESADRWEDVISVTLNALSGSEVDIGPPMEQGDALDPADIPPVESTYHRAVGLALAVMERRSAAFVSRLESQLGRDRKRLRSYYHALLREPQGRSAASAQQDQQAAEDKRRAVDLELRRKLAELDDRYAVRARLEPLAMLRLDAPVLGVRCDVFRKKASRRHTVYWNALTKALEPMACSACGSATFSVAFSDDQVEPLCARCAR